MTDTRDRLLPTEVLFEGAFPRLSRRLRFGIVGGGRIAVIQAMGARLSDRWEMVAGALSSDPVTAKARGADWFLPDERCFATYEEMATIEAERPDGIDAVVITTPNDGHYGAARAFLEAGIDVLCDKPLTNDLSEAIELLHLARKTGLVFCVAHAFTSFPMVRQAREMVQGGVIGQVNQIHTEYMQDWMTTDATAAAPHVKWRLDPAKTGLTSCTGDIGTHAHHMASFVSGLELTHLRAELHVCGLPKTLDDTVMMMTRYADDIPGTLLATRVAPGNRGGLRLRIYGSLGGIEWDHEKPEFLKVNIFGKPDQILSRGQGDGIGPGVERFVRLSRGNSEGWIEAWANLYTEFALAVAARRDGIVLPEDWLLYPRVEDGARGVRFIEAAVESHKAGGAWGNCQLEL